uniref:Uncharacterized protein n=1 Tax=Avena sativa TaxID=4498 RepID=A0ACD5XR84_AVESA
MGVGGTLDYLSELLGGGGSRHRSYKKKRKQFQTVELKVRMDCEGCELKVRNALSSMKGVQSVEINRKQYKVTVQGFVEPHKVVKRVQATGKKAEIWPYIPYNLVAHPYAAQTYDKKAPPGYVRKVDAVMPVPSYGGGGPGSGAAQEERLTTMFSDDNPNACSIM